MLFGNTTNAEPILPRERASHPRPLLTVTIRSSRVQRVAIVGVFVAVGVVLWTANLASWGALVGSLLLFLYAAYVVQSQRQHAVELELMPDDALALRCTGERDASATQILTPLFVSGFCVAFLWKREGMKPAAGALFLTSDQMTAEKFHALRVRLKYLRTIAP